MYFFHFPPLVILVLQTMANESSLCLMVHDWGLSTHDLRFSSLAPDFSSERCSGRGCLDPRLRREWNLVSLHVCVCVCVCVCACVCARARVCPCVCACGECCRDIYGSSQRDDTQVFCAVTEIRSYLTTFKPPHNFISCNPRSFSGY
jgi:hypothetical protein